jgi:hypothetical protein
MSSARLLSDGIEPAVRAARAHAMKNCVSVISAVSRLAEREVAASSWLRSATLRSAVQRLRELLVEDLADESAKLAAQPRDEVLAKRADGGAL